MSYSAYWRLYLRVTLAVIILVTSSLVGAKDYLSESEEVRNERMAWWREARFGLFIHWGPYSIPAGVHRGKEIPGYSEWIMTNGRIPVSDYEPYARQFNPVHFNADRWAEIAHKSGVKYVVVTSKHHDGFCLWDTNTTDYDVIDFAPLRRDVIEELAIAFRKRGIRFCIYYSITDWHHPDAQAVFEPDYHKRGNSESNPSFSRYSEGYMRTQLEEILDDFWPALLWFDGEWIKDWTSPQGKALYNHLRRIKPDLIINNRIDKGRQGRQGMNKGEGYAGDFGTPEQVIPSKGMPGVDWESCMTMNDSWGFNQNDDNWKSTDTILRNLIDIASKGGNFLLNIGPTAEGRIPEESIHRLEKIGEWLRSNGESIYGTQASPLEKPAWGRFTQRSGRVYAHVFDYPEDLKLHVAWPEIEVSRAYLLNDPARTSLDFVSNDTGIEVTLPEIREDALVPVVAIEFSQE